MINVMNFTKEHWQKGVVILLIVVFGYFWWKVNSLQNEANEARVEAQNQIAELSHIVRESSDTWSRLAQQVENSGEIMHRLEQQNQSLATMISQRDEQIVSLTTAIGQIRPINVVVRQSDVAQTEVPATEPGGTQRQRVEFDTIHEEYLRIHGYTLTNPAEANVSFQYTRPINFTAVTTQAEDLSWRTYLQSDLPGLEIGQIESSVNPVAITAPSQRRRIEQNIEVGLSTYVGVRGTSGAAQLDVGYDFGALEVEIGVGGIVSPSSVDFSVGGRVGLSPFDL